MRLLGWSSRRLAPGVGVRPSFYAPEWTNQDDHDPGITLVQLFSFLSESLLFRLSQTPELQRRVLRQLGLGLAAAGAAVCLLIAIRKIKSARSCSRQPSAENPLSQPEDLTPTP